MKKDHKGKTLAFYRFCMKVLLTENTTVEHRGEGEIKDLTHTTSSLSKQEQIDLVALAHRGEPMRYQDDGDVVGEIVHRFHHRLFGKVVKRAGGFI